MVTSRATLTICAINEDNIPLEIKYHSTIRKPLGSLFSVHRMSVPACLLTNLTPTNIYCKLEEASAVSASIYQYNKGQLKTVCISPNEALIPFPLRFLIKKNQLFLIKEINTCNKCEHCGSFYKVSHTCTVRRRDFYFHNINSMTADWWETIPFNPIGSVASTQRLFIVYDLETYTWHGRFGKQLVPFMLVFKIFGDPYLYDVAHQLAIEQNWCPCPQDSAAFYCLTPEKRTIGLKFKSFRDILQQKITSWLWSKTLQQNPTIQDMVDNSDTLESVDDVTFEHLKTLKLQGDPTFIEVYIIGHNINGFDEIVMAAQVVNNKADIAPCFKIIRNFMPRQGKILFNDISYNLPNPKYEKRKDFSEWEQGCLTEEDCKYQFVKFCVRDTYALTHTSLQNAAKAYNLPVSKGHCPYGAVNEFYMCGSYQTDADGFPAVHYWKDQQEYLDNKQLWKDKKNGAYDIVQNTLDYCILDVIVTAELVEKLQKSYQEFISQAVNLPACSFNVFQRPTISSNSHAIFKQILFRQEKPTQANFMNALVAPSREMYDYVRASIRGGRCYPTYVGVLEEPIYVYDICGMYASALTHPMPSGKPLNTFERALAVRTYEIKMREQKQISYFDKDLLPGILTIDADPPDEDFLDVLPPLCSRKGGRLCWTNERLRGEIVTSVDVLTLHNRGWAVRILPDERTTIFPQWKCLAKEYVQLNIEAKEKADREKNQTMRSIAKLLSNALYGSFATKLDNKKIVFSDQIEDTLAEQIASGEYSVKSSSYIETDNFSAEILPEFVVAYPPVITKQKPASDDSEDEASPFIGSADANHVTYNYKPITFLDANEEDFCLHTLEKTTPLITNNRYASQIASFVLAWTRAFIAEWASFLYEDDLGTPIENRILKSVYGDTDSLFTTEAGHQLMETKGKKRLKKNKGPLVFDENKPELTWLVECETQCEKCKSDAYASQSVFLAPKLYALKDTVCSTCKHIGKGKLRAKGHATTDLSFDTLVSCYYADQQESAERFKTSRLSLKKTLVNTQAHVQPFTVVETTLSRTLRPWKDRTLAALDQHRLVPYSHSRPNPRNKNVCWMEMP